MCAGTTWHVGVDLVLAKRDDDVVIEINSAVTTSYVGLRSWEGTSQGAAGSDGAAKWPS